MIIFKCGQRNTWVAHRSDHIHERNFADHGFEEVRPHGRACTDEQSARRAAYDGKFLRGCESFLDKMLGAGDEIGKCIFLVHHLAVFVPITSHVCAAANVSDGENESTVKEREARGTKRRVNGRAVGAVSIHKRRIVPVPGQSLFVNN